MVDDSAIDDGAFAPIFPGADRVSSGGDDAVRTRDLRADSSAPPRADAVTLRVPRGGPSRAVALVAIVGAALGAVAVLVWFATRSKSSVSVRADLRAKGAGVELVVRCDRCQDGTALELLGHKGSFVGGSAALPIGQEALRAGRNALTTTLTPPNANSREVSFVVDVPFVVRPSLAPLARGESAIDVVFDVTPEVKEVTVDGTPLEIDRKVGRGIWHVKIPPPGDDMRAFKSTVRYAVLVGAAKREGGLEVAVPYAPIHLGLPGRRPLISDDASEVEVTGRTGPNATVRFGVAPDAPDARAVTADKDGLFRGKAPVSKTAVTLEIAAFGAALAPRTIGVPLVRGGVQALRAQVKATFEAIAHAPDAHVGELVDVVFVAARSSEEDGRPFVVGESQCTHPAPSGDRSDRAGADGAGCPAVRVLLPAGVAVAVGQTVEALAVVVRGVPIEKGRSTAVELDASVVVGAHR